MTTHLSNISSEAAAQCNRTASDSSLAEVAPLSTTLRSLTPARIGLRRTGISIATSELLDFQLAHATARDAVHQPLQPASLLAALQELPGYSQSFSPAILTLHSAAANRQIYLQRPDLGRQLDASSLHRLRECSCATDQAFDLSVILVDGLSALAVERHAAPLLAELLPMLSLFAQNLHLAPICIVEQGRVAIGDEIGRALFAKLVVMLIGERPGLSSPDSLGAYITWLERSDSIPNRISRRISDAERNCISNIRVGGLNYAEAAARLLYYICEARSRQLTGVAIKDPDLTRPLLAAPSAIGKLSLAVEIAVQANMEGLS